MSDGFTSPNYTQAPNDWFDTYLPEMGFAELKVTAVIIRNTFGFHRRSFSMGLRLLARMTGLTERNVIVGADAAEARGLIRRTNKGAGDRRRTVWELIVTTSPREVVTDETASLGEVVLPPLGRQTTSLGEARLNKVKQTRNKTAATAKAAPETKPAAAAAAHDDWWRLDVLAAASKLPAKRRSEIMAANPSPGALVSKHLYAMTQPGIKSPALWAAAQATDNPGAWEGEPFESLAGLGPAGLAHVLAWVRDDASFPLQVNGASGAALAFRGELQERHRKEPARQYAAAAAAIADLGLSSITQPVPAPEEPAGLPEREPARRDAWTEVLDQLRHQVAGPAYDRLMRCELVSAAGGRLVLAVPTKPEFDWLTNRMGKTLAERFSAELTLRED